MRLLSTTEVSDIMNEKIKKKLMNKKIWVNVDELIGHIEDVHPDIDRVLKDLEEMKK